MNRRKTIGTTHEIVRKINYSILLFLCMVLAACGEKAKNNAAEPTEDAKAKQMLQGIWVNDDDGSVAFLAKGDSIFYPDSTSQAVTFMIVGDSLILNGRHADKYKIVRQAEHLFEFKNRNGDIVKLQKSTDEANSVLFNHRPAVALNQNQLIKRDTIVNIGAERYHCYMQVNPTTYKVVKPTYNNEGVEVDNVYHDNIVHISVYNGERRVYSKDFSKTDFKGHVKEEFLRQSILSDIILRKVENDAVVFQAQICMPDSPVSCQVDIAISTNGKMSLRDL